MIVTLTPNPSLDRTLDVERLARGAVLRAGSRRVEPGGKGINVARALHAHGHQVRAVLPSGGAEGDQLVALLVAEGLDPVVLPLRQPVRANVSVVEPDGTVTKINEPGPSLTPDVAGALLETTAVEAAGATWVVASGSLPPGVEATLFADLIRRAGETRARVAVDTSGPGLEAALAARPDLVKPNAEELEEVTGLRIDTLGDAVSAARLLQEDGAAAVLASLGPAGALLVDRQGILHAHQAVLTARSSVGAGDATLAGYLVGSARGRWAALRTAVAFGAGAVALPGSQMPGPADVSPDRVQITDRPDFARPLSSRGLDAQASA